LRRSSRPHDGQCGRFAGRELTDLLRGCDQIADVSRGVVRRHVSGLVPEQGLPILEADASGTQAVAIRVAPMSSAT